MQRFSSEDLLSKSGYGLRFRPNLSFTLYKDNKDYHIPGDGITTHINLACFLASKTGVPSHLFDWPDCTRQYTPGLFGAVFGKDPTADGDLEAVVDFLGSGESPEQTTTSYWGGVFEDAIQFPTPESVRTLEGSHYVNTLVSEEVKGLVVQLNPHLAVWQNSPSEYRIIGGRYPFAGKDVTPPLHLSILNRVSFRNNTIGGSPTVNHTLVGCRLPTADLRSIYRLRGDSLRSKLNGPTFRKLAAIKNKEAGEQLATVSQFGRGEGKIHLHALFSHVSWVCKGSQYNLAHVLRNIENMFLVDFEELTIVNRSDIDG